MKALAASGTIVLFACTSVNPSSTPRADQCQPGVVVTCGCVDGTSGTQSCAPDGGGYTACDCSGDAAAVLEGGGSSSGGGSPDGAAGACSSAVGTWTAAMPLVRGTQYTITFAISAQLAQTGGATTVTWASAGQATVAAQAVFSPTACTLGQTYAALCAGLTQCGDTDALGADVCPVGDALTATFAAPSLSWWDAQGCTNGASCVSCAQHVALSFTRQ